MKQLSLLLLLVLFPSCWDSIDYITKMEEIKCIGNYNPGYAIEALDSIRPYIHNASQYTQMKFRLLEIRLKDKANILPASDSVIVSLIPYFNAEGTDLDKQEVYYYAGSVYRDLHDTPRALENFLHSLSLCEGETYDSVMKRNAYSNLQCLYFNVQDFENSLLMALGELHMNDLMKVETENALLHVGASYLLLDSLNEASDFFDRAYELICKNDSSINIYHLLVLLNNYSYLEEFDKAKLCYELIKTNGSSLSITENLEYCLSFGNFFQEQNELDSAEYYYTRVLNNGSLEQIYDAARHLYFIKNEQKDIISSNKYASIFISTSDSLNLGERQRLAATVNNEFQYYRNQEAEKRIKAESERRRHLLLIISFSSALIIVSLTALYNYRQKRQLRIILAKTEELTSLKFSIKRKDDELNATKALLSHKAAEIIEAKTQLSEKAVEINDAKARLIDKEIEINEAKSTLTDKETEINSAKALLSEKEAEIAAINRQLERFAEDLKIKEAMLIERTQQSRMLIRILNQSEMEETAEDVIASVRKSAVGMHHMTSQDWKKLYHAVDSLSPAFKDTILEKLGNIN